MNSHFQSSATTSTSIGFTDDSSGLYGSSSCVVFHVSTPRNRMISVGTVQITTSIAVECDQFGA